jgi:RimJ/RimL family protein N-acetyltransferase
MQPRSRAVIEAPLSLETARLIGRPVNGGDMGYMRHILGNPQCMRWLSADGRPQNDSQMQAIADRLASHWKSHGFGVRLFFQRGGGAFAGWCGLRHQVVDGQSEIELLYSLRHSLWQRGLGSEMARAAVNEGVEVLGFRRVVAFTLPDNVASQGVMRACGLGPERDITFAGLPHVLFSKVW